MMDARLSIHSDGRHYYIRWFCADGAAWFEILDDFKYEFAQWERRYDPGTRTWSVPLECRARVRAWADRWFDPDARGFTEDGPAGHADGSRSYSQGRNSYARYGEAGTSTGVVEDAYRVLHLYPTAPPELVQAAHRILIKQVHPDAGGSHEDAVRINAAWERVRSDLERRAS
jgi:hypothetical protein